MNTRDWDLDPRGIRKWIGGWWWENWGLDPGVGVGVPDPKGQEVDPGGGVGSGPSGGSGNVSGGDRGMDPEGDGSRGGQGLDPGGLGTGSPGDQGWDRGGLTTRSQQGRGLDWGGSGVGSRGSGNGSGGGHDGIPGGWGNLTLGGSDPTGIGLGGGLGPKSPGNGRPDPRAELNHRIPCDSGHRIPRAEGTPRKPPFSPPNPSSELCPERDWGGPPG